jgi:hypothetical protein
VSSSPIPPLPPDPVARRSKKKLFAMFAVVLAIALFVLWSLGKGAYHDYRLASAAVDHFHEELDRGNFESIYSEATEDFRSGGTLADFIKVLETVHQKMGNSDKKTPQGFHVNWKNGRHLVDQVFDTQFALGHAQESFIWVVETDQVRLYYYQIHSPNLP